MKFDCCQNKKSLDELLPAANFLKAVSEKNRLKILCLLKNGEKCVCDIWQHLKLPQNLTSHHLKELKKINLISSKKIGLKIIYRLNEKTIEKYLKMLNKYLKI